MTEGFGRVNEGLVGLTAIVGQLAAAQLRTDEQIRELRESDARLQGHIDSVESHLNILIDTFERHLREDHGRPPS